MHKRARAFEFENFELFQWRALRAAETIQNFQIRKRSALRSIIIGGGPLMK